MDTPTLDILMYHNDKHGIIFIHLAYKYAAHTQYIVVLVIPGGGGYFNNYESVCQESENVPI